VLSPALDDISNAALWFESKRSGLGDEFWQTVDATLVRIEQNPFAFAKSEFATQNTEWRSAVVRRFHYVIHFAIANNEVQVAAVIHAARKPGFWLSRI
jgi:toxin ParE1/3/4